MKTRASALTLSLAVLAGILASCGGASSSDELAGRDADGADRTGAKRGEAGQHGADGGRAAAPARRAQPPRALARASRAVVWAVGDVATPGSSADRVAALVRRGKPARFLYLGDVYETGTADEFRRWYHPRFGSIARRTQPTIGNHEWDNRFSGYYKYWAGRKGRRQPPWSKTRVAGWEILSLNSQAPHGAGSPQVRWLEKAVTGPGNCRIAFWHRPRYSAGAYGAAPDLNPFWNRLAGHARIVLSGHDHNLQRHRPQRGLTQYVAGAGGRGRYGLHPGSSTMVWGRDDVDGALRIVLRRGRALLEFRGTSGRLLDRSRRTCTPGEAARADG
jgi:acid phosphatase type 7